MAVITISRGSFSGGKTLAECLAGNLGYRCVDRDVIVTRAAARGVSEEELRAAIEKPPGFLDRFTHTKYLYLTLFQAALTEEVRSGQAVYHGNAGHLLLKGGGPVLRVRIVAPLEYRIRMCGERMNLGRDEAVAYIERMDEARRKWTQYLYGVDWRDASLYDVVVNLEHVSFKLACEMISHMARQHCCFEFTAACQRQMDDLWLASHVKAALALNEPTAHLEFEVAAEEGIVRIKGKLNRPELAEEVRRAAGTVPGLLDLNLAELVAPSRV